MNNLAQNKQTNQSLTCYVVVTHTQQNFFQNAIRQIQQMQHVVVAGHVNGRLSSNETLFKVKKVFTHNVNFIFSINKMPMQQRSAGDALRISSFLGTFVVVHVEMVELAILKQ